MRNTKFTSSKCQLVYGEGLDGNILFSDDSDCARFAFLILHFQSPTPLHNISWHVNAYRNKRRFCVGSDKLQQITKNRYLHLIAFTIKSNSFHLLVQNIKEMATSVYMQRVLTAYSKYFNDKYNKSGHVFRGPYKTVLIEDNSQLLDASVYMHKNLLGISDDSINNYESYDWSSYKDYVETNRWGKLLNPEPIIGQFKSKDLYKNFVSSNVPKGPYFKVF